MEQESLFGDKPKKKRTKKRSLIPPLIEEPDEPKYEATDDDLPLIFWPEPTFDEEV